MSFWSTLKTLEAHCVLRLFEYLHWNTKNLNFSWLTQNSTTVTTILCMLSPNTLLSASYCPTFLLIVFSFQLFFLHSASQRRPSSSLGLFPGHKDSPTMSVNVPWALLTPFLRTKYRTLFFGTDAKRVLPCNKMSFFVSSHPGQITALFLYF